MLNTTIEKNKKKLKIYIKMFEIYEIAWAMALVILAYMWAKKRRK